MYFYFGEMVKATNKIKVPWKNYWFSIKWKKKKANNYIFILIVPPNRNTYLLEHWMNVDDYWQVYIHLCDKTPMITFICLHTESPSYSRWNQYLIDSPIDILKDMKLLGHMLAMCWTFMKLPMNFASVMYKSTSCQISLTCSLLL